MLLDVRAARSPGVAPAGSVRSGAVVVRSRFGAILGEIAEWLADGLNARLAPADAPDALDGELIVLVGAGIEFDGLLRRAERSRRRRCRVVLWAFDPFPPPGLPAAEVERGLEAGRHVRRWRRIDEAL